jgi:hypothetical protein
MTTIMTYSCMKKVPVPVSIITPLFFVGSGIKIRSDPDPGYRKMVGYGIRDKHPGSATLIAIKQLQSPFSYQNC